ncbi:GAF and ANTAR domain-containing protein [Streptomyces sp. NPDC096013]|uniref:GAF and ANTAR domain-containing protein n=1 Tax=Streptomyces sp. NPDC096013 TaxID=3366069 RepID=UPI0038055121
MSRPGPTDTEDSDMGMSRVQRVAEAFISVSDVFDSDVDALVLAGRLVNHCIELTEADRAGLLFVDARGRLRTVVSSDRRAEALDRLQARTVEGPGVDSLRTGGPVRAPRLDTHAERWPEYVRIAEDVGVHGVYALPVTARDEPVGTLNLYVSDAREIPAEDLTVAASLAGVAVDAMLRWRPEPPRPSDVSTRIQSVISSKAALETAIGMLAASEGLTITEATRALRDYARRHGTPSVIVAQQLLGRALALQEVLSTAPVARPSDPTG